jgi:hypothetical protein
MISCFVFLVIFFNSGILLTLFAKHRIIVCVRRGETFFRKWLQRLQEVIIEFIEVFNYSENENSLF